MHCTSRENWVQQYIKIAEDFLFVADTAGRVNFIGCDMDLRILYGVLLAGMGSSVWPLTFQAQVEETEWRLTPSIFE